MIGLKETGMGHRRIRGKFPKGVDFCVFSQDFGHLRMGKSALKLMCGIGLFGDESWLVRR